MGARGWLLHALPFRGQAQDGTAKWLRHLLVTIRSLQAGLLTTETTQVDQQDAAPAGFQASRDHSNCKAELALRMIQGRWKLLILRELTDGVRRFSDLQRALSVVQNGVSQKMLTAQLRELEADGVVQRTVYPEVPPRVEYALTALGGELIPVLDNLHSFGEKAETIND